MLAFIDDCPSVPRESLRGFLNGKVPECVVTASLGLAVAHVNDRSGQYGRVDHHRLGVNDDTPVFQSFLAE